MVFADLVWVIILFSASDASTRCTKSTRICGRLVKDVNCRWCSGDCGLTRTTDGCPCNSIALGGQTLEVVDSFCYLGATINAGGGCTHSAIARAGSAWGKFRELLPLLTNTYILIKTRGNIFNICVRSVLLYGSKCWALRKVDKMQLERNNWAMIR